MKNWLIKNHFLIFAIVTGIILFTISLIRARITGITYDEAFSYMYYAKDSIMISIKSLFDTTDVLANNHMLNSFFIAIVNNIANVNYVEILIRLPNIIFYAIYLFFAYKFSNQYKARYLCFILLVFNYGVHEFFGLARGYGMAAALVLSGIYYLKLWTNNKTKYKFLNLTYILLMLAAYANTSTLIVFASIAIYTIAVLIKDKTFFEYLKKYWYFIGIMFALGILIIRYHFNISSGDKPLYGGGDGFFQSVLVSMFETYGFANFAIICAILYIISYLGGIIYLRKNALKLHLFYIPIICYIVLISLTLLTNQLWITGRCLIPFMPLIVLGFIELWETIWIENRIVYAILSVIMVIPFLYNLNIYQTREWCTDYQIKADAYEAFEQDDNTKLNQYIDSAVLDFYRDKILERDNFNIMEGVQ